MKNIKGQKVILRPAVVQDRKQIFAWLTQSDLTASMIGLPNFPDNLIPTWEEFVDDYNPQFFNDVDLDNGRSFIIEVNGEGVGHINYNPINRIINTVELDIWLANSKYCNQGYGSDAINTLCKYLADNLNCEAFILAPSARNKAAIRVYEKCGFRPVVDLPENFVPDYYDTVVMIKSVSNGKDSIG